MKIEVIKEKRKNKTKLKKRGSKNSIWNLITKGP